VKAKVEVDDFSLKRAIRALNKIRDNVVPTAIAEGIPKCLDAILKKSQQYVPVETGELRDSGFKEVAGTGRWATGIVGYSAPHALPVHERVELQHAPPTGAKFLERAARESKGVCTRIMKRQIEVS